MPRATAHTDQKVA